MKQALEKVSAVVLLLVLTACTGGAQTTYEKDAAVRECDHRGMNWAYVHAGYFAWQEGSKILCVKPPQGFPASLWLAITR